MWARKVGSMNPLLRRLVMLGTPLVLGALLITHPVFSEQTGVFHSLLPQIDWWLALHVVLLPLFCLIALAAFLLIDGVQGMTSRISRFSLGIFVICYPAFDVLIGIGTGTLVRYAAGFPANQQIIFEKAINALLYSPIANLLALLGSFGWEVGILMAALSLSRPSRSRLLITILVLLAALFDVWSLLGGFVAHLFLWWIGVLTISILLALVFSPHLMVGLLVLASFLFGVSHVPPFGPLSMACFFLAALQHELLSWKSVPVEQVSHLTL